MSKVFAGKRSSDSRAHLSYVASSAARSARNGTNVREPESFSSQNESPRKPVLAAKNIVTWGQNTYWKPCTEDKKYLKSVYLGTLFLVLSLLFFSSGNYAEFPRHARGRCFRRR